MIGDRYILDGHEPRRVADLIEWATWMRQHDRRVARTELLDGSEVSTVFLGLDHSFADDGPPVLFETCLFFAEDTDDASPTTWSDGRPVRQSDVVRRYSTWAEAELGHIEIVEHLTEQLTSFHKAARTLWKGEST